MTSRRSVLVWLLVLFSCQTASAQIVYGQSDRSFDRGRLAGLWWVGTLDGSIDPGELVDLPPSIEIGNLGVGDSESGWMWEGDFGLARRHRLRVSGSNRTNGGVTTVTGSIPIGGIEIPAQVPIAATLGIKEFEANYNFLFVANRSVDAGFLAGVGHFDATVFAATPFGDVDETFATPYPSLGGNALFNPQGRIRAYAELTGFPKVTVDDFTGWKMSVIARVEMFITQNIGAYVGYRSYEVDLNDKGTRVGLRLKWTGLVIGGAARF